MLEDGHLIAFVPTTDLERAREFYAGVLELEVTEQSPVALVLDANGTMLRVTFVPAVPRAGHTVLGWSVPRIEDTVRTLASRGVTFQRHDGFDQDDANIWTAPNRDRVAWFEDHDGNTLSVTQFADPS